MSKTLKLRRGLMPKLAKALLLLLAVGLVLPVSAPLQAAPDPQGVADSIWIEATTFGAPPDSVLFVLRLNTDNTLSNRIAGIGLPFLITVSNGALISLDTTVARTFTGSVISAWPLQITNTDTGGLNPTVSPVHYSVGGITFGGGIPAGSNLLLATFKLNVNGLLLDSICIDTLSTPTQPDPLFVTEGTAEYIPRWYSSKFCFITDVKDIKGDMSAALPQNFDLKQNYPNPFNATTQIRFDLPKSSHVKLEIFNVLGQKVKTLVDEELQAGYKQVTWDGKDQRGNLVSTGIYFYRIRAENQFTDMRKMLLIK
jgi:hypothetical protein